MSVASNQNAALDTRPLKLLTQVLFLYLASKRGKEEAKLLGRLGTKERDD